MRDRVVEIVAAVILVAALVAIQVLIGGTRLIFAFPSFAAIAVAGLLPLVLWRSARTEPDRACLCTVAIFFGYALARALLSPDGYIARYDITLMLAALLVYFVTATTITSSPIRMSVFVVLLVAAVVHVGVGAIQFRAGINFMPISFLQRFDYGRRASGFYICPDHLAGMLEVIGVFGLSMVCWSRWPAWSKMLIGYATAVCYLGLLLTGSRGGYVSAAASLVVFALLSTKLLRGSGSRMMRRAGLTGLIVALVALTSAIAIVRQSDFLTERTKTAVADRGFRLQVWQAALKQTLINPVFGTGSRTYQYYGRKFRAADMQRDPIYAHNDYLQLLAEYGAVGLVAFAAFLVIHFRRGWADAARLGPKRIVLSHRLLSNAMALNIAALAALSAYVVHSIVDFNLHIPANALLLALVFGILANPGVRFESRPVAAASMSAAALIWRATTAVIAVVLAAVIYRLAPGEYYAEHARTALRDYRLVSAIELAKTAITFDDRNPLVHYYLGRARVLAGDRQATPEAAASFYGAAVPEFERARALSPFDETYAVELGLTFDSLERFTEAEWLFDEALAMDPKSISVRAYYGAHLDRWKRTGAPPKAQ